MLNHIKLRMNKSWGLAMLLVLMSFTALASAQKLSVVGAMQGVKQSTSAEVTLLEK